MLNRVWLRRTAAAVMYVAFWLVMTRGLEGPISLQALVIAMLAVLGVTAWIVLIFWLMFES